MPIDPTKPVDGVPAVKADLRANLLSIKNAPAIAMAEEVADLAGQANLYPKVNSGETGFEFVAGNPQTADDTSVTVLQAGTGASTRTLRSRVRDAVSVKDFGALGDGATDDTTAIENAWAFCRQIRTSPTSSEAYTRVTQAALYFPPGDYIYNGTGLTAGGQNFISFNIFCDPGTVRIVLGASSYFCRPGTNLLGEVYIRGFVFKNGLGTWFVERVTASTPARNQRFEQCVFFGYTVCALGWLCPDMGLVEVRDCQFEADMSAPQTIGVAYPYTDNGRITHCYFKNNHCHIRLGEGGNRTAIDDNYFAGTTGINTNALQLIPKAENFDQAGSKLRLTNNKFGNEQMTPGDIRIICANLNVTGNFTTQSINTADTAGNVQGWIFYNNEFLINTGNVDAPIIRCYVPNMRDIHFDEILPKSLRTFIEFPNGRNLGNHGSSWFSNLRIHNTTAGLRNLGDHPGLVLDPLAIAPPAQVPLMWGTDSGWNQIEMVSGDITGWATTNASTVSTTGPEELNAVEITYSAAGGFIQGSNINLASIGIEVGDIFWIEVPLARSASTPLIRARIIIRNTTDGNSLFDTITAVPATNSGWVSYVRGFALQTASKTIHLRIQEDGYSDGSATKVRAGKPRIYRARQPNAKPRVLQMSNGFIWIDSAGKARVASARPTAFDSDGVIIGGQT